MGLQIDILQIENEICWRIVLYSEDRKTIMSVSRLPSTKIKYSDALIVLYGEDRKTVVDP